MNLPLSTFDFRLSTRASRGFTLVELMVTIGIFTMMTGVVLSKYGTFDTNAKFANVSEDIVLALRQAQVYGVGSKAYSAVCGTGSVFTCPYGVYFSTTGNSAIVFADINTDRVFSAGEDAGLAGAAVNWGTSIVVDSLLCDGGPCALGAAYVTFNRPNPDAFIANAANQAVSYGVLSIALRDTITGKTATVTIRSSGQISLQ